MAQEGPQLVYAMWLPFYAAILAALARFLSPHRCSSHVSSWSHCLLVVSVCVQWVSWLAGSLVSSSLWSGKLLVCDPAWSCCLVTTSPSSSTNFES